MLIWYAVGRGLPPLEAMSRAVGKRRARCAWRRSRSAACREELKPLAASLNALLARLDDALGAQRRFTADAAHELRTPLAALKLQVERRAARRRRSGARARRYDDLKAASRAPRISSTSC